MPYSTGVIVHAASKVLLKYVDKDLIDTSTMSGGDLAAVLHVIETVQQ